MNEKPEIKHGRITISTTINLKMWSLAKQYGIKWSDALRSGISLEISKKTSDEPEYVNPRNYEIKIQKLAEKLGDLAKENEKLKKEYYEVALKRK